MWLIILGGALGTYLRYMIGRWFHQQPWTQGFPWGTLVINVIGSFILGAAATFILERLSSEHHHWFLIIGAGFCGGFTTFSAFEWETYHLIRESHYWSALAYVLGSVVAGFIGLLLGILLVSLLVAKK